MFDWRVVAALKLAIPLAAAVVLLWDIVACRRASRSDRYARVRDAALVGLALSGFLAWSNFSVTQFARRVELHEFFHYYLGAKYHGELGYTRLYRCTVAAELEQGTARSDISARWMRDLETNTVVRGDAILAGANECHERFTDERWVEFKHDALWFRDHMKPLQWQNALKDHGYNATPVWTMAGALLADRGPVSWWAVKLLALIDRVLLVGLWGIIWWGFGWRTACVAVLWWGTNYPARYHWTAGSFLRADWLVLSVAGICLMRRTSLAGGGFALAYAALLRVFPGCAFAGLGLAEAMLMWRERTWKPSDATVRCTTGALLAVVLLVPLASWVAGGGQPENGPWRDFADNSRRHLSTASPNRLGLKPLVSFEPSTRAATLTGLWLDTPWDTWYAARNRVFERRKVLYWGLVCGFLALLALAVDRRPVWVTAVLGTGLMAFGEFASYYYSLFLVFAFLREDRPWIGVALCGLSAATNLVAVVFRMDDERYTAISALLVVFVVLVTAAYARSGRPREVLDAAGVPAAGS